ncbi:MAG: hypothetical protein GXO76_03150 [Calditrichaeota bacterium]|nr:hypothetical protein [Calditrichota bacterium]
MIFAPLLLAQSSPTAIKLDSRRELFVDSLLIAQMNGTHLQLHHPHDAGEVLRFDKPWEGPFCGYITVIKDGPRYRLYYRGLPTAKGETSNVAVTCYAESRDGIHWTKPDLGLYEIMGTRDNNVVLANVAPITHNFCPFLDTRSDVNPARRYKGLGGTKKSGLVAFVSPDGIHWKKLREKPVLIQGAFDSQNVSFWSEWEKKYVCYFRTWTQGTYKGFRTVSRSTSEDFIHWSKPVEMSFGNTPRENIYTNQTAPYFRAPHIYISVAARFMPHRQVLTAEQARALGVNPKYFKDCSDAVLMSTRGGNRYNRTFMEGFIRPGIGLQNWVSRTNYPALNVVQTGPTELSIYVGQNYAQPTANLHRYTLRLDGFVSVNAPYAGGEMVTKPFTFQGRKLYLNFSTSAAGQIGVEIQDATGRAIPGFSLAECHPLIGNEIDRAVSWKNGEDVSRLQGRPIRLRFVMKDADLYAVQFR